MKEADFHYEWAAEAEKAAAILGVAKEHLGEEICKELDGKGPIDDV